MQKLSVLVFSKDDLGQALELAKEAYGVADEIILMDASSRAHNEWMVRQKARLGLGKLKIHRVVALGYREPLMMYALKKCRNSWVISLNTDERMSSRLRDAIPRLLKPGVDAYSIALYSLWSEKSRTFVSQQVRLFRKEAIEFRGLLHEKPIVHGTYRTLPRDECINHRTTGMMHTTKGQYAEMERFERYTYARHNLRILGQLDRARGKESTGAVKLSAGKKALLGLLRIYEALGLKSQEQEVSNFDYYMFWLMRDAAHQARRRSVGGMLAAFGGAAERASEMRRWRSGSQGDHDFEIAKMIGKMGVTKFLRLDDEKVVDALGRKYRYRDQGVGLLIRLLREKYMKKEMQNR